MGKCVVTHDVRLIVKRQRTAERLVELPSDETCEIHDTKCEINDKKCNIHGFPEQLPRTVAQRALKIFVYPVPNKFTTDLLDEPDGILRATTQELQKQKFDGGLEVNPRRCPFTLGDGTMRYWSLLKRLDTVVTIRYYSLKT
jgi:hypothetical protein